MKGIMKTLKWILGFGLFGWLGQALAQNTPVNKSPLAKVRNLNFSKSVDGDKSVVYLSQIFVRWWAIA